MGRNRDVPGRGWCKRMWSGKGMSPEDDAALLMALSWWHQKPQCQGTGGGSRGQQRGTALRHQPVASTSGNVLAGSSTKKNPLPHA